MGPLNVSQYVCFYHLCYFNVLRLTYFLMGQSIQLLDVRRDESMNPDQHLVFGQGGQEEAQRLHQPHALAALHTDTPGMIVGTPLRTRGETVCRT